jgi:hypothetical protein
MKIPVWLATIIVSAAFTSQGWLILAVIELKTDVATLKQSISEKNSVIYNHHENYSATP